MDLVGEMVLTSLAGGVRTRSRRRGFAPSIVIVSRAGVRSSNLARRGMPTAP